MRYDAILFDLFDTLLPWGPERSAAVYGAIEGAFAAAGRRIDDFATRADAVRNELVAERDASDLREISLADFVVRLFGDEGATELADRAAAAMHREVLRVARAPDGLDALLGALARRHPLGVVSNFMLGDAVDELLAREGLTRHFVHVEVSIRNGFRKPHPDLFEAAREKLATPMERTLMVGDSFWADVVGGHRAGLLTALTHEHRRGPTSDPRAPEIAADRVLSSLHELAAD